MGHRAWAQGITSAEETVLIAVVKTLKKKWVLMLPNQISKAFVAHFPRSHMLDTDDIII